MGLLVQSSDSITTLPASYQQHPARHQYLDVNYHYATCGRDTQIDDLAVFEIYAPCTMQLML